MVRTLRRRAPTWRRCTSVCSCGASSWHPATLSTVRRGSRAAAVHSTPSGTASSHACRAMHVTPNEAFTGACARPTGEECEVPTLCSCMSVMCMSRSAGCSCMPSTQHDESALSPPLTWQGAAYRAPRCSSETLVSSETLFTSRSMHALLSVTPLTRRRRSPGTDPSAPSRLRRAGVGWQGSSPLHVTTNSSRGSPAVHAAGQLGTHR